MSPKSVNGLCLSLIMAGALIALLAAHFAIEWLVFIGLAVMMASVFLRITFYRCPYCGKYLDRSSGEFCPYCGKKMYDKNDTVA